MPQYVVDQACRRACAEAHVHIRAGGGKSGQDAGQTQRGGGFQAAYQQRTLGRAVLRDCPPGVLQQHADLCGIRQQPAASGGETDAASVPKEQRRAKLCLQQPDACRYVGLHGVEFRGRAAHAATPCNGLEDPEIGRIHQPSSTPDPLSFRPIQPM